MTRWWFFSLLLGAVALPVDAHQLMLFGVIDEGEIRAQVYFPNGGRARQVPVQLLDSDGNRLAETLTDQEGNAIFPVHPSAARLTANSGDGHLAQFWLVDRSTEKDIHQDLSASDTVQLDEIVSRHIAPLRKQIQELQVQRQWRDILGGLGYLIGLAGVGFYFSANRTKRT